MMWTINYDGHYTSTFPRLRCFPSCRSHEAEICVRQSYFSSSNNSLVYQFLVKRRLEPCITVEVSDLSHTTSQPPSSTSLHVIACTNTQRYEMTWRSWAVLAQSCNVTISHRVMPLLQIGNVIGDVICSPPCTVLSWCGDHGDDQFPASTS